MNIRKATLDDARAISGIYNHYVENTAIALEAEPITEVEAKQRIGDIINSGHLIYVGELGGKIIGFCHTQNWQNRSAYKATAEESIFLDREETGKGYGAQLLGHLLKNMDKDNVHTLIASICISNENSIRLHEKFGFKQVSHLKEVGRKFGHWHDVGHWQLIFN